MQNSGSPLYNQYSSVPARWGLQQATLDPGSDETWVRDPLVRYIYAKHLDKANLPLKEKRVPKQYPWGAIATNSTLFQRGVFFLNKTTVS